MELARCARSGRARVLLAACGIIWGATFVAMKVLTQHFDTLEIVGLRFAIGLPLLFAIIRAQKISLAFDRRDATPLALGGAILLYHFLAQPYALQFTSATNTGWIITFSPLAIALLSFVFLREKISPRVGGGIALAAFGIALLVSRGDPRSLVALHNVGDWLILSTAFTWALYTIVTRDVARRRSPLAVTSILFVPLLAVGAARLATHASWSTFAALPIAAWVSIAFLGVFGTLAQWFWQLGVARIGAARAGVYVYLEPIASTVLGVAWLGESYDSFAVIGSALVLGGVIVAHERG
ncbi:MAG: DMT family transporter [Planctomycetota bacterium]